MNAHTQIAYLQHVRDALSSVAEYTAGGRDVFFTSRMVQDAVVRNLEIVGEAVKRLDLETRARASDVPWRRIAGMRDQLVHHYFGVDLEVVWQVVEAEVPPLLQIEFLRELDASCAEADAGQLIDAADVLAALRT